MKKNKVFVTAALAALTSATGVAVTTAAANAQTAAPPTPPPTVTTRWSGAPETREEDRRFRVNGRLMYDVASTDADFPARRVRRSSTARAATSVARSLAWKAVSPSNGATMSNSTLR
jgi:hypothetical protein